MARFGRTYILGGLLLITVLCAGCPARDPFGIRGRGVQEEPTPVDEVEVGDSPGLPFVRATFEAATRIRSMDAVTVMRLDDRRENTSVRFNANLLAARPDRIRLLASRVSRTIMEMALVGESIDVWVPDRRTLHRGNLRELTGGDMDFHPDEIVGQLLTPVDRFFRQWWDIVETTTESVVVMDRARTGHRNRLTIRLPDHALLRHEILTAEGEPWMDVRLDAHKALWNDAPEVLYPHRLTISFHQDERELTIVLRTLGLNPAVRPNDFWLLVPDADVTVKALDRSIRLTEDAADPVR